MERSKILQEIIQDRFSARSYLDKPVSQAIIDTLLNVAMQAPSACNLQPWEFIVVNEPKLLEQVKATIEFGHYNAPIAMIICANTKNIPWQDEDWKIDCTGAVTNMMLMATSLGLASVWLGSYDEAKLRLLLDIPKEIKIMNLIYFGYPKTISKARSSFNKEAVYYNKYDKTRNRQMRTIDMLNNE